MTVRNMSVNGTNITAFSAEVGPRNVWVDGLDYNVKFTEARNYGSAEVVLGFFSVQGPVRLTNASLTLRAVWPGAALAAVLLQATFQVLPTFVRLSREVVAVQALGATALLLIWIYVMANVIVFGAEVNWWYARRDDEEIAGLA